MTERDALGAFLPGPLLRVPPLGEGPLSNLIFAAKDNFDVAGTVTGAGNPDWAKTHPRATQHAEAIQRLLGAGAALEGKTILEELAFSLTGINMHYGAPLNPAARNRVAGGSSSGSASAVAGGVVDFALGTDTAGSVRIPASYCGLYGIRPSHGRVSDEGVVPLAKSFDVAGWFSRTPTLLARIGSVLLEGEDEPWRPRRLLVAVDCLGLLEAGTAAALKPAMDTLCAAMDSIEEIKLFDIASGGAEEYSTCFRRIQGWEAWQAHGSWIEATKPTMASDISQRFALARNVGPEEVAQARSERADVARRLADLLGDDGLILLQTTPGPAPRRDAINAELERFRAQIMALTAPAGLGGLPQVTLPIRRATGAPVGLSVIGARNCDCALLNWLQCLPLHEDQHQEGT